MAVSNEGDSVMDLAQFRDDGYLQEANRQFFHPLGLAMAIRVSTTGEVAFEGIYHTSDPEGMIFADDVLSADKAARVEAVRDSLAFARTRILGSIVQRIPKAP